MKYWTDDEQETLRRMWNAGKHLHEAAAALGRTLYSVESQAKKLRSSGFLRRRPLPNNGWTPADIAALKRMHIAGASVAELCAALGRTRCAVWCKLKQFYSYGELTPRLSKQANGRDEEIVALIADGLTNREIAKRTGAGLKYIEARATTLRKHGKFAPRPVDVSLPANAPVDFRLLQHVVCAKLGVTPAAIVGKRRSPEAIVARQVLVALARRHTRLSYPQLAERMKRDHSTLIYGAGAAEAKHADAIAAVEAALFKDAAE